MCITIMFSNGVEFFDNAYVCDAIIVMAKGDVLHFY
jgi:hypothetical protein